MIQGLVSVIIPVYNVEKYLDRCVKSAVNQTYRNLEIILVDDGSTDRCPEMCEEWAKKDARVHVIHKRNQGLGYARNTGIEYATGEYICFSDSDDYIAPELVERCLVQARVENADIVCFGDNSVTLKGDIISSRSPRTPKVSYEKEEIREKVIPRLVSYNSRTGENWSLSLGAWASFYSAQLIQDANWRFVSERDIISEDYYSVLKLYKHVRKVTFISEPFYYYTINPNSLSRKYRRDRFEKLKHLAFALMDVSRELDCQIDEEIGTLFLGLLMGALRQIVASGENLWDQRAYVREIMDDDYLQMVLMKNDFSGDDLKKKMLYKMLKKKNVYGCIILCAVRNLLAKKECN